MQLSPEQLIELIKTLKECNCSHFKNGHFEVTFGSAPATVSVPVIKTKDLKPVSLEIPPGEPEKQPPHIVQEMKSLMKLSDEELIDRMFPAPEEEQINGL